MATTIEYIFSLQDKISAKVGNITVTSDRMLGKFADLEKKTLSVGKTFNETGRTIGSLREKINLLQAEREWIPAENIEGIRAYNREMKKLTKEVDKLESLNGGKFKKWGKEAFAAMPGSDLIRNPLVAGAAAIGFAGKSAMNFDEGMAKVNITAQLDEKGLSDLKTRLTKVAEDNKTDILVAPVGFEKINSQLNDVDLSLSILDASLKGSKAGFTDLDTVSGALAQTLSIVGKENTNAQEVLDTFFAAKRVGAGEFSDFAKYMPNLIAGASNLGINFKEVAGTFAYMTGKGQSAERSAVLMENAFSVLGRADVRGKMEKAGVNVFDDTGKIRGVVDIFRDLEGVMSTLNDEQKSSLLEKMGLVDKEAKNAFAVMTSDITKLQESMNEVGNSAGETDKALTFSQNTMMKATEVWTQFKNIGTKVGGVILPVISVALGIAGAALSGVCIVMDTLNSLFSWWSAQLQEGNPLIWGATAAITALSAALLINYIRTNAVLLGTKAKVIWDGIHAAATWLLTTAQWALNAAFLASPLGWICLGIGAVVGAIVYCWQKLEGFRQVVLGVWSVIKGFGSALIDSIVTPFNQIISGIGKVGSALVSLVKGDFKEAAAAAKDGFKEIGTGVLEGNPLAITTSTVKNTDFTAAWENGQKQGTDNWNASQQISTKTNTPFEPEWSKSKTDKAGVNSLIPQVPAPGIGAQAGLQDAEFKQLMSGLGKGKNGKDAKGKKKQTALDLNDTVQDYKESSDYTAVAKKLAPVTVDFKPRTEVAEKIAAPASKVIDGRAMFADNTKKVDEGKQEYAPEKTDFLQDIMMNVRKIAAVAAIPLAMNLAAPETISAQNSQPAIPETRVNTPDVNMPKLDVPQISMPKLDIPEISIPKPIANFAFSPAISTPDVNMPKLDVPKINTPKENIYQVEKSEKTTERTETTTEQTDSGRTIYVDRVCENIVIHVANTDKQGTDEIRAEIIKVLDELSMYQS